MDRNITAAIVIVFLLMMLGLMAWGWSSRRRRQAHLPALAAVPSEVGEVFGIFSGLYVATTAAADALDRIAVRGLGFRSRVIVTVAANGIVLQLPGQADLFIPVSTVTGIGSATWAIDRVVEDDGLSTITWNLGETAVTSSFRFAHGDTFSAATSRLAVSPDQSPAPIGSASHGTH